MRSSTVIDKRQNPLVSLRSRGKDNPWKRPFYDCFWIASCSQALSEFHKALAKFCFWRVISKQSHCFAFNTLIASMAAPAWKRDFSAVNIAMGQFVSHLFGRSKCIRSLWAVVCSPLIKVNWWGRVCIRSRSQGKLRASSYEPGQPVWLGFRDLDSPLFPS